MPDDGPWFGAAGVRMWVDHVSGSVPSQTLIVSTSEWYSGVLGGRKDDRECAITLLSGGVIVLSLWVTVYTVVCV